jgi:hypothetical protein
MKTTIIGGIMAAALTLGVASSAAAVGPSPCTTRQLTLSVDSKDGEFDGMQKSGTELSIRNSGRDCMLPALPAIAFLDARGRVLPLARGAPVGMHPGPVMIPVRLAGGHRAATDLSWVTGPVYAQNRALRVGFVQLSLGTGRLRTRFAGVVTIQPGRPGTFIQTPLRAMEGMAAH